MIELGLLRKAQRELIEKKSAAYMPIADAIRCVQICFGNSRGKILDIPARVRRRIEEKHPGLLGGHPQTARVEETIRDAVYEIMEEISTMADSIDEQIAEHEGTRDTRRAGDHPQA